jgi:non-homologous end joining protein Ku
MPTATAPAPSRQTTSFTLSWGVVNIPMSVYTGTEATRVTRKEFITTEAGALVEVGRSPIRKDTGEVIDTAEVGRYAQAVNGEWVLLTDEEIATCTSPKGVAEIVTFVPTDEVAQYLSEGQVQVRPKTSKGKVDPSADRAFALLCLAMDSSEVVALVKVALRGPARYGLLDSTGTFTLIYTADAIRQPVSEPHGTYEFSTQELTLASTLIDAVGVDTPVLSDDTAPVVQEFVNAKSTGVVAPVIAPAVASGQDLRSQLQASVAATKAAKGTKAPAKAKARKGKAA